MVKRLIQLEAETADMIRKEGYAGQTYDDIINELIEYKHTHPPNTDPINITPAREWKPVKTKGEGGEKQ